MKLRNLKVRYVAYFFGWCLLGIALANFYIVRYFNISENDVFTVNKSIEMQDLAQQINYGVKNLIKYEVSDADVQEEINDLNKLRSKYQAIYSLLKTGGNVLIKDHNENYFFVVAPLPASLEVPFAKLNEEWTGYQKDINEVVNIISKVNVDSSAKDLQWLSAKYKRFMSRNEEVAQGFQLELAKKRMVMKYVLIAILVVNLLLIAGIYMAVRNLILLPIGLIAKTSKDLAKGNLSQKIDYQSMSEIGYIAKNVNDLADILNNATEFSKEIGQGNLDAEYKGADSIEVSNKESILGALQSMRDRLIEVAEKDRQERWVNTGLAKFADILRNSNTESLEDLSYSIISNLVSYLEANQGVIFVVNDESTNSAMHYLETAACYAMNKRKHLDRKIGMGEGLVGQAFQDKDTIYVNDVPNSYEKIASAMGGSTPRAILIVPLLMNEQVQGVIEILSLKEIPKYKIAFVGRVAENIASTVSIVKNNARTKKLLIESEEIEKRMQRRG